MRCWICKSCVRGSVVCSFRLAYLNDHPPQAFLSIGAEEIMSSPCKGFHPVEKASTILHMLRTCQHNGFPVYDHDEKMTTLQGQEVRTTFEPAWVGRFALDGCCCEAVLRPFPSQAAMVGACLDFSELAPDKYVFANPSPPTSRGRVMF